MHELIIDDRDFNPTPVRLKQHSGQKVFALVAYFNSIGTIETFAAFTSKVNGRKFLFHIGTIEAILVITADFLKK